MINDNPTMREYYNNYVNNFNSRNVMFANNIARYSYVSSNIDDPRTKADIVANKKALEEIVEEIKEMIDDVKNHIVDCNIPEIIHDCRTEINLLNNHRRSILNIIEKYDNTLNEINKNKEFSHTDDLIAKLKKVVRECPDMSVETFYNLFVK